MFGKLTDYIGQITLIVLALITVRDIIARLFGIPRSWKISKLFYSQYDRETLLDIFKVIGIEQLDFRKHVNIAKNDYIRIEKPEERLVYLLSKYTYDFKTEYGINTPTQTNFYINTMEATHFPPDLELMTNLIANLINIKEGIVHQDFIITPKCGNPMLGHNYTTIYNNIFILAKYENDKSRSNFDKYQNPLNTLMINFEGFAALKNEAEKNPEHEYSGYVIDCNQSGGSLILNPMIEFNRMLKLLHDDGKLKNIKLLREAFILFRPDAEMTDRGPFDGVFKENGLMCHRYFDLDEQFKSLLFSYKCKKDALICKCLTNYREKFPPEFINKLKCDNKIMYN